MVDKYKMDLDNPLEEKTVPVAALEHEEDKPKRKPGRPRTRPPRTNVHIMTDARRANLAKAREAAKVKFAERRAMKERITQKVKEEMMAEEKGLKSDENAPLEEGIGEKMLSELNANQLLALAAKLNLGVIHSTEVNEAMQQPIQPQAEPIQEVLSSLNVKFDGVLSQLHLFEERIDSLASSGMMSTAAVEGVPQRDLAGPAKADEDLKDMRDSRDQNVKNTDVGVALNKSESEYITSFDHFESEHKHPEHHPMTGGTPPIAPAVREIQARKKNTFNF